MASFDPNAWYQVSESRVGFNSSFQVGGNGVFIAKQCDDCREQLWQFVSLDGGKFQLRNKASGIKKQLGVCYNTLETDASKTRPCMTEAGQDKSQRWSITAWGDNTYYLENVANGSDYRLDVHPGNPVFMSSAITTDTPQPAQHWMFQSLSAINDGAYSTTITTATATSSATSTITSTNKPGTNKPNAGKGQKDQDSGLSSGAKAGIGIGVALIVLLILGAVLFLIWRKRRAQPPRELDAQNGIYLNERKEIPYGQAQHLHGQPVHEAPVQNAQIAEMGIRHPPVELDAGMPPGYATGGR